MDFGLILPSYRAGATTESIDAAAEAAARLGWHSVFTTDHLLVEPSERSEDYYTLFDALNTLAYLAAKQPTLKLGASVVVVPMRNAVELAKELATIDALSGGRLIVGVGVGWNETEFEHLGYGDRFSAARRVPRARPSRSGASCGAATRAHSTAVSTPGRKSVSRHCRRRARMCRSGSAAVTRAALRRAGRLGQGYHSSASGHDQLAVRIPIINAAAAEAGRPAPTDLGSGPGPVWAERRAVLHARRARPSRWSSKFAHSRQWAPGTWRSTSPRPILTNACELIERFDREVLAALR